MTPVLGFAAMLLPVFFRHPAATLRDVFNLNSPIAHQDKK